MSQRNSRLTEVFASIDRVIAALDESHGPAITENRLQLVKELASRLPLKYLPAATSEQIEATERMLTSEGSSRQNIKILRSTLMDLFDQMVLDKVLRWHPLRGEDQQVPNPVSLPEVGLLVEMPGPFVDHIAEILGPVGLSIHAEATTRRGLERAAWFPFSFVVCAYPIEAPARFLDCLRSSTSLCRTAGVVLIVDESLADDARRYVGRGANRVLTANELSERIGEVVGELNQVSERIRVRVPVEVAFNRSQKREKWLSENLSNTGILLRTSSMRQAGELLDLEFKLPRTPRPVRVVGEIVRSTTFGREDFSGYGIRFLSFSGDSQYHLETFLQ